MIPKGKLIKNNILKELDRNYLSSLDLIGVGKVTLTIDRVEKHEFLKYNNGTIEKNPLLLYFKETPKPLKLNVTNIKALIMQYKTNKVRKWLGKKVKLDVVEIKAFGKLIPAVRVVR